MSGLDLSKMTLTSESNLGDQVWCDGACGEEFTNSKAVGGITFGSKAICPNCAPDMEKRAKAYGELSYIKERAAPGQTFRDFVVVTLRGGKPGKISIYEQL